MRKLGWYAISALVGALIFGGVVLLGANLYVQSLTVQHRIRQALTANLKMPVTVRKTTITPWDGLRIDGIVARPNAADSPDNVVRPDFLTAESFRVRFALLPLLRRQLTVRQVLLDHPHLTWPQDAEGHWQFPPQPRVAKVKGTHPHRQEPPLAPETPAPETPVPVTGPVAAASPVVVEPTPPTPKVRESARSADGFAVAVDRLKLRHGTVDLLDARDRLYGHFDEVNLDGHLLTPGHATGEYWFETANLPRAEITLRNFHGGFAFVQDTSLTLSEGHGDLAGGHVLVSYHQQMSDPGGPFEADCQLKNVSLERLFAEAGSKMQPLAGSLQGSLSVTGLSDDSASRQGSGHLELLHTHLKNLPLLQAFGEALRIQDLSRLEFKKAKLDVQLQGTSVALDPFVLESRDIQVSAHGQYLTDDDQLNMHGRLVIDQAVSHQLPQFIESNFIPCGDEAPGSRYIDFKVGGPLNKPSTNLFDRVLSGPMNGFFENLLAPKPKSDKRNPSHHENDEPPVDAPGDDT